MYQPSHSAGISLSLLIFVPFIKQAKKHNESTENKYTILAQILVLVLGYSVLLY